MISRRRSASRRSTSGIAASVSVAAISTRRTTRSWKWTSTWTTAASRRCSSSTMWNSGRASCRSSRSKSAIGSSRARASAPQSARDQLVQPRMELVVGGQHLALRQRRVGAAEIGDVAARLPNEEDAGGEVPELQVLLPEAVVAAGGDPGEVQRRRPVAANAGNVGRDGVEDLGEALVVAMPLERDAGRDQR